MKTRSRLTWSLLALIVTSLACGLVTTPPAPPTAVPPTAAPPTSPADVPAQPPATQPPVAPASNLPTGLATITDNVLTVYDLNGTQVSQVELSQQTYLDSSRVHLAGPMPASGATVPLLYFSFDNTESLLYRDGTGQIFTIQNGTSFMGLTGVPSQPLVAYSQAEYLDTALRSKLYAGSIQTLPSAAPVSVIDDPESWALKPILLEAENGTPTKIWYTRIAYGIGGDIVYEPRKGLFTYELASGQTNTVLDNSLSPWDISGDKNWFAYSVNGTQSNSMCIKNIQTNAEVCFPALPASESRGAGNAFFSPDAQYVAWMEADGSQMGEVPNFKSTVRVGQNNGAIIADLPMDTFANTSGIGQISRAEPVTWLDGQTLLVQVRGQDWNQVALLRYNIVTRESSSLASGEFIGLLYP